MDLRRARFGNGWIRNRAGEWQPLTSARFTASGAAWEAKDNIDAGVAANDFFLATGGTQKQSLPLRSQLQRPPTIADLRIPPALKTELTTAAGEP